MCANRRKSRAELIDELESAERRIAELERQAAGPLFSAESKIPPHDVSQRKDHLRQCAGASLKAFEGRLPGFEDSDVRKLLHELNVHQVELEMQNDELRLSEQRLQSAN